MLRKWLELIGGGTLAAIFIGGGCLIEIVLGAVSLLVGLWLLSWVF